MLYLKQSTASQATLIGPFVDEDDGKTAETALTIANTDIRLSKNGGNMAAKTSGGGTHDEAGWYTITLDATDTNTVGRLQLSVHVAGALPVFGEYQVTEEAIYDALYAASAAAFDSNQRVDVAAIAGTAQTANDNGADINAILIDTAGLNGDAMRGTDSAALASVCTEGRLAELDAANLPADVDSVLVDTGAIETDTQDIQSRLPAALVTGRMSSDAAAISGSTAAADNLEASAEVIVVGAAQTGTLSTTQMSTNLSEVTNDHYIGRSIIWTGGVLLGQATDITDYVGTNGVLTYTAVTEAPSNGDTFVIV